MTNKKIEMSLLISNKPGILAAIMMQGNNLGLMYQKHQLVKLDNDQSRMTIIFEGPLNHSKEVLIEAIEYHTDNCSVDSISITDSLNPNTNPNTNSSLTSEARFAILRAHYVITPESLQVAEDKLTEKLGPVAVKLVQSAAAKTKHIGDLFLLLAEELEVEERNEFLSLVTDLQL